MHKNEEAEEEGIFVILFSTSPFANELVKT